MKKINVMLVDDHALVRAGLREMLDQTPGIKVIADVSSGEEAITAVKEAIPDVILMDIKMPGIGGFEATRKLLRMNPMIKILVITSCEDDIVSKRFIDTGAKGYLTKGADLNEMVAAIQAVNSGEGYISHNILTKMVFREKSKDKLSFTGLSDREWEVTEMVLKGEKAKDIGDRLFLSPKTVNSYRYRIFKKLGVKNDIELVKMAIRHEILELDDT